MKTGKSKDHLQRVFLRFLYLIMGSILSLDSVMAQENLKVSGQVTDNKGEAIIGASVKVLKTGTGTDVYKRQVIFWQSLNVLLWFIPK